MGRVALACHAEVDVAAAVFAADSDRVSMVPADLDRVSMAVLAESDRVSMVAVDAPAVLAAAAVVVGLAAVTVAVVIADRDDLRFH